jgi:hypothetical protein
VANPLGHILARALIATACLLACLPAAAMAANGAVDPGDPRYQPPKRATIRDGLAVAPRNAPRVVKRAIAAANKIVGKPYRYGGGHASVQDKGYDCSGTVSYALIGAKLLKGPLDSSGFMGWAARGKGRWFSIYANPGHAYMVIAGLRLDTGSRDPNGARYGSAPGTGPRWNKTARDGRGYVVRHPRGL